LFFYEKLYEKIGISVKNKTLQIFSSTIKIAIDKNVRVETIPRKLKNDFADNDRKNKR
jgi:hypothetical protein